jgi:hypothetical protein
MSKIKTKKYLVTNLIKCCIVALMINLVWILINMRLLPLKPCLLKVKEANTEVASLDKEKSVFECVKIFNSKAH